MHFKVRAAAKEDCKEISRMIMELAVYENMADQVKTSHEDLKRDGFSPNPFYECLIAEVPDEHKTKDGHCLAGRSTCGHVSVSGQRQPGYTVVGYALYFYTYSTWKGRSVYMEDLYVMPDFRGKGIGTGLMAKVAQVGVEKQCVRLQLSVLEWNKPSLDFYIAKGAEDLTAKEGWHFLRFHGQTLDTLAKEAPKD
uniref:N-acetyltransferase domain-containing protein n=1 Tax=Oncorhynchus tshawytscha TaxID=74940 RepID=A0AAZ3P8M1_ONCTS